MSEQVSSSKKKRIITGKWIKVNEGVHIALFKIKARLEAQDGKKRTFNDVIEYLITLVPGERE